MIERIKDVLRIYFEVDDNGYENSTHDPYYTAQNALDDIHEIVGDI